MGVVRGNEDRRGHCSKRTNLQSPYYSLMQGKQLGFNGVERVHNLFGTAVLHFLHCPYSCWSVLFVLVS